MQLTEDLILEIIGESSFEARIDGRLSNVLPEDEWCNVAQQILSLVQSKNDIAPPLPQAAVMRGGTPEPLPPNLCCSICGYFCNNYHHYNCWFEVDGGNGA